MKKRTAIMFSLLILTLILSACGSAGENKAAEASGKKSGKGEQSEEINEIERYSIHLSNLFSASTKLQTTFSTALDGLYTGEASEQQFADIITHNLIERSRELVETAESYNFAPDYFEINQSVVSAMNTQHQIFLDAVSTAKEPDMFTDRNSLRQRLVDLKQEQLAINNNWKNQ